MKWQTCWKGGEWGENHCPHIYMCGVDTVVPTPTMRGGGTNTNVIMCKNTDLHIIFSQMMLSTPRPIHSYTCTVKISHQSFVTTALTPTGNSRDNNFLSIKKPSQLAKPCSKDSQFHVVGVICAKSQAQLRPKWNICVVLVSLPTLFFPPYPKHNLLLEVTISKKK